MAETGGRPLPADLTAASEATAGETLVKAEALAGDLVQALAASSKMIVLAESCTGGLAAELIARIPGASRVLWGSFVSYTLEAKTRMLGLSPEFLETYGAVSRETACAMAEGALEKSGVFLALALTGLAGPGGDGSAAPVGAVWIAVAVRGTPAEAALFHFKGGRNQVRNSAALAALGEALKRLKP
jgi:PncC family amidohydrolase